MEDSVIFALLTSVLVHLLLYKKWLHERVTWEIVTLRKFTNVDQWRSRGWHWFSKGVNFPCYPLVRSITIILYWMLIKHIVYITFVFKTFQDKWIYELLCISYSVNSNAHTTPVRMDGKPYAHQFCAVVIFSNITIRQAKSPVGKFHHMLGRGFM